MLHRTVREHLETYLAAAGCDDDLRSRIPPHVEQAFRAYLRCGILAHGFSRAYCHGCGHDFLIAFSCHGRDICPSCSARRMAETAAHLTDQVLPRVGYRQWVLSVPRRVRWHLREKPEAASGLLRAFLCAVETALRRSCPGAPPGARFGAVAFVHRLGDALNSHVHDHVVVTDGVFSYDAQGGARFHGSAGLGPEDTATVQRQTRRRGLRWLHRHDHLDDTAVHALDAADHAGSWSVDASVAIAEWDRHGLERLVRYCARPPLSQERLGRLDDDHLVYRLRKPTLDGRTELILTPLELLDRLAYLVTPPRVHKHRYCGALLLARIYEYLPLVCTRCGEPMRLIAFVLDPPVVERILGHIGEPVEAPAVLPARSPPQGELSFDAGIEAAAGRGAWPEIEQTGGGGDGWGRVPGHGEGRGVRGRGERTGRWGVSGTCRTRSVNDQISAFRAIQVPPGDGLCSNGWRQRPGRLVHERGLCGCFSYPRGRGGVVHDGARAGGRRVAGGVAGVGRSPGIGLWRSPAHKLLL